LPIQKKLKKDNLEFFNSLYQIEIINYGESDRETIKEAISKLNNIQDFFLYSYRQSTAISTIDPDVYTTEEVFNNLLAYRKSHRQPQSYLLGIVHAHLKSNIYSNLFGSSKREEFLGIITTRNRLNEKFTPPKELPFFLYYFVRYSLNYVAPEIKSHKETRDVSMILNKIN
jgi:hypothetical protein